MYRLRSTCHTIALIVGCAAASLANAAPPSPPSADKGFEKCFEDYGLKTHITVRLRASAKGDVSGVFESSTTQQDDPPKQVFAFTGHKDSAAQSASYRIVFTDNHRPAPLRKHRQITWKIMEHPEGETLLVNLYDERLGTKKPASSMFYDVELATCAPAKSAAAPAP